LRENGVLVPLLAWKNLVEDRGRFVVALAGIMFAVALVAIQLGVFNGFVKSAGLLIDESSADIWITAQEVRYVELTLPLPYDDIRKTLAVNGVERAEPMVVRTSVFKGPAHRIELIRVVGFNPNGELFRPGAVSDDDLQKLRARDTILVDRANLPGLNLRGIGDTGVIGPDTVRVVALTQGTQPIVSASFIYTSMENQRTMLQTSSPSAVGDALSTLAMSLALGGATAANHVLGPSDQISYILVKAKTGTDVKELQHRLEAALPGARAYTRDEMADITRSYWRQRTGIGFILGLGALVGAIVGVVVVGQILYTSVSEHIKEYGTMKAMGAPDSLLYRIIAMQSVLMAVIGFVPGIALALWVASYAMAHRGTLILLTPQTIGGVFVIALAMCLTAAVFAMQRVTRVDPYVVFKA
jgi:putative ABC transport system permease protein